MLRPLLIFCLLAACGHADDKPEPQPANDPIPQVFNQGADRLVSMLDDGWVVSRTQAGEPAHQGDSLIWSGIDLAALDCARGSQTEAALIDMVTANKGKIQRHPSLPGKTSMDGALGLYYGIAARIKRCPGSREAWRLALEANPAFWENPLNTDGDADLPPEFTYVRDLLAARLVGAEEPKASRQETLELEIAAWAAAVNGSHAACFRVHLGLISLQTIEQLDGQISQNGRNSFCAATRGMDLPTVDLWCGRPVHFLQTFQFDQYEFRHQRCGSWESPDGNGLKTPGLDLLVFIRNAYALPD